MSEASRYVASIPPLHTIKDPDTRRVLEAIVSGWRTRNGETKPDSNERFITKGELKSLVEGISNDFFVSGTGSGLIKGRTAEPNPQETADLVKNLLAATERDIRNSPLWAQLGSRIERINLALVAEQLARIEAIQELANALSAEAGTRLGFDEVQGSAIAALESTTDEQATKIAGLTTRVDGAQSTIIELQTTTAQQATSLATLQTSLGDAESVITELQTTTAAQSQTLDSLSSRVGDTESSISTLNTTTANQANSLTALRTSVDQKNRVFVQAAAPASSSSYTLRTNDLWYDTANGLRVYRWTGEQWEETSDTRIAAAQAAITEEATTRASADTAITTSVTTQFAQVGSSLSALQTSNSTLSTRVSSLTSSVTKLEASVGEATTAIETEATARVDADGKIESRYTVKVDTNGYVAGYGLISSANDSTPTSEFIVRADKFAIGAASGPGIPEAVPFKVYTRATTLDDGTTVPAGVYLDSAYVDRLDGVYIKAGTLDAGAIYTGNEYVDRVSRQPIPATGGGVETVDFIGGAIEPFSASNCRLYGPRWHRSANFWNRVRSGEVAVTITVSAVCDHYLTLWYRVGSRGSSGRTEYSAWSPILVGVEPQGAYGTVTLSWGIAVVIDEGEFYDFGVSATDGSGTPFNDQATDIYQFSMLVVAFNL